MSETDLCEFSNCSKDCISKAVVAKNFTGFVRVLENLESPGILLSVAFSRTGKCWKTLVVLESSGNLLNSS